MKKFLSIFLFISLILLPSSVFAKSYKFNYKCDAKQPLGDGTFYMTCHLSITNDFEINHIEGSLILKNVTLDSVRMHDDWVNNSDKSSNVSFTSKTDHKGTYTIADFVFTGSLNVTECEASFSPILVERQKPEEPTPPEPEKYVCAIVNDEYYGKNGDKVTLEKYYEQCCNYVCAVVDNKYYFNSKGESVSYEKFLEDCSKKPDEPNIPDKPDEPNIPDTPSKPTIPDSPDTGIEYGYIIIPLGILSLIGITKISKKKRKIYKI